MITGFDHVVIAVHDLEPAIGAYETLLGGNLHSRDERDGVATAVFATSNIAVEIMAPAGEGGSAKRLRDALEDGEGLKSLVFATNDIARAQRRLERLALAPDAVIAREGYRSMRLNTERTRGVRLFVLERDAPLPPSDAQVLGLDHIVIRSSDVERTTALYGARFGLDMRLDREVMGRRLVFFRCGDAIVEIAESVGDDRDRLWGLSWRVANADVARERLMRIGLNVSEVRSGKKLGTRVFSVRDGTCGVPTLMIESVRPD